MHAATDRDQTSPTRHPALMATLPAAAADTVIKERKIQQSRITGKNQMQASIDHKMHRTKLVMTTKIITTT